MPSRQLSTSDFCASCLEIGCTNDKSTTVKQLLNSPGYQNPMGYSSLNYTIQYGLEDNGGCSRCINTAKNATAG